MNTEATTEGVQDGATASKPAYSDFSSDPRCSLNEQSGKWNYVGDDGVSYEYDETIGAWFPMVSESGSYMACYLEKVVTNHNIV
jgi:hypothetical protein